MKKKNNRSKKRYKKWLEETRKLHCEKCGIYCPNSIPHHILHKSVAPTLKYEKKNGIHLCDFPSNKNCHLWAHQNKKDFESWLEEMFPGKLEKLKQLKKETEKQTNTF